MLLIFILDPRDQVEHANLAFLKVQVA
jgi:hypothetical protein